MVMMTIMVIVTMPRKPCLTLPAHQHPRQRAGRLAIAIGHRAGHDRRLVALRLLQQPAAAGGQVVGDVGALVADRGRSR